MQTNITDSHLGSSLQTLNTSPSSTALPSSLFVPIAPMDRRGNELRTHETHLSKDCWIAFYIYRCPSLFIRCCNICSPGPDYSTLIVTKGASWSKLVIVPALLRLVEKLVRYNMHIPSPVVVPKRKAKGSNIFEMASTAAYSGQYNCKNVWIDRTHL